MAVMDVNGTASNSVFADLPAALLDEVLSQTGSIAQTLVDQFRHMQREREAVRATLDQHGLLLRKADLGVPTIPTTCGTDGSYAIERLLSTDLVAAAAVAVEGLTPPSETRHWEQPHHRTYVAAEPHSDDTATILRALMLGYELELAAHAPHDLVLLDGSFTLPIIFLNQALHAAAGSSLRTAAEFVHGVRGFLRAYQTLLSARRTDKQIVSLPKYTTRREISARMGLPCQRDDRSLLTQVLSPGEYTAPLPLEAPESPWHLQTSGLPGEVRDEARSLAEEVVHLVEQIHVVYFKPNAWLPALRIEMASSIAHNPQRLAIVLQGLEMQCATSAMLEPYPNYMADRMVKALARALPAFRQIATQQVAESRDGDVGDIFLALHGYRSESGRK